MHCCRKTGSTLLSISLLFVGLSLSSSAFALNSCPAVPGDLNGNLVTDVVDVQCSILATLSQLDITGQTPPPSCLDDGGMSTADQNCDDGVTIVDVTLCIQLSLGIELSQNIDEDGDQCHDACEIAEASCDTAQDCPDGQTCVDGGCEFCPSIAIFCLDGDPIDTNDDGCADSCPIGYNPCLEKECGEPCTICPPSDPNCSETDVLKACDPQGVCSPEPDGGFNCDEGPCGDCQPNEICEDGECVLYNPCMDKGCGEPCTLCAPNDLNCTETDELKVCDPQGLCSPEPDGGFNCDGGPCGDCQPNEICENGECVLFNPCMNKECGEPCTLCLPSDLNCTETDVVKACDEQGLCSPEPVGGFDCGEGDCEDVICNKGKICIDGKCEPCPVFTCFFGDPFDSDGDGCDDACTDPCASIDCAPGYDCINGECICPEIICVLGEPVDTNEDGCPDSCSTPCPETQKPECKGSGPCEIGTPTCGNDGWECIYQSLVNGTTCENTACAEKTGICQQGECVCDDPCPETEKPECKGVGPCEIGTPTCGNDGWECIYQSLVNGTTCENTTCAGDTGICEQGKCICDDPCPDTEKPECKSSGPCETGTATCGNDGWECVYQSSVNGSPCNTDACPGQTGVCQQGECTCFDPCEGLTCGEPCFICPPGDPDCFEISEDNACNLAGICEPVPSNGVDCGGNDPCETIFCVDGTICVDGECQKDVGMIITEFMANPVKVSDSKGEWIELYNASAAAIPLSSIALADNAGNFGLIDPGATGIVVPPNTSIVAVRNSDISVNGGIISSGTFSFSLNNGGDIIQVQVDGTITDVVDYTNFVTEAGKAHQYDTNQPMDPVANDAPEKWCPAMTPYGDGDLGTPGAPNEPCGGVDECPDGQMPCGNTGECLPNDFFCNGTEECPNGEDELECLNCEDQCEKDFNTCVTGGNDFGQCAAESDLCYASCNNVDCPSGDVLNCFGNCSPSGFLGDGVCQEYFNCSELNGDNGDCGNFGGECNAEEIDCGDGTCVPGNVACNGFKDCATGADESSDLCGSSCPPDQFECGSGLCIPVEFVCDGEADCADSTDEEGCNGPPGPSKNCCNAQEHDGTPGCDDMGCESLVCSQQEYCCTIGYDADCAALAQSICDLCMAGPPISDCCGPSLDPGCDNGEPAIHHQVVIQDMKFIPETLIIKAGDKVTWVNAEAMPHTVTAPCSTPACLVDDSFDSGFMGQDATFTKTFYNVSTISYDCTYHPNMTGTLKIVDSCEGCIYDKDPTCFDIAYDSACVAIAQSACGNACSCP